MLSLLLHIFLAAAPAITGAGTSVKAVVGTETVGKTMKYVGYNQGYFVPGSNVSLWWEYSGVNSARIWADLKVYSKLEWFNDRIEVRDEKSFAEARDAFRASPLDNVPLQKMDEKGNEFVGATNSMVFKFALDEMRRLGIDVLIQSSIYKKWYDPNWEHRWELWKCFYSQAFWCALRGGVQMFALCNEPDHKNAGPMPLDTWIILSKVASDAARSALQDVNRIYGTSYEARFVGPVTAGHNRKWWAAVAAEQKDGGYIDIFSIHSYNRSASAYKGVVEGVYDIIRSNHPEGRTIPVVFTESGRWMNAKLIDHEETMDTPSLFTEWAGEYAENMLEGCYGMWAFKFGNTPSNIYPRGIKSGHHHMWKGRRFAEDSFENLALGAEVKCSCGNGAGAVVDGDKNSAWVASAGGEQSVEISFASARKIGGLAIYSGSAGGEFTAPDRIGAFRTEALTPDGWKEIAVEKKNKYAQVFYTIDPAIEASALRLCINDEKPAKLREVKVFGEGTISKAEECYGVGGAHRTAEVVRLFAKGFKNERPMLRLERDSQDAKLDLVASLDPDTGVRYLWIVRRGLEPATCELNLAALGVNAGSTLFLESVSPVSYGEGKVIEADGPMVRLDIDAQSVNLLTIAPQAPVKNVAAKSCKTPRVEMNAHDKALNSSCEISFKLPKGKRGGRVLLGVHGSSNTSEPFRFHAYGKGEKGRFLAGELAFTDKAGWHWLDVTDAARKYAGKTLSFTLVRELREPGDDYDNGHFAIIDNGGRYAPLLKIW